MKNRLKAGHLGLLVDPSDTLQIANIERILGAAVARMLALETRREPPFRSWPFPTQSCASVSTRPSCALLASSVLTLEKISRCDNKH
jgi:hypothetical protein